MEPINRNKALGELQQLGQSLWEVALRPWDSGVLPAPEALRKARMTLLEHLPDRGHGLEQTRDHILHDIVPAFNGSSLSPNYYGFVTGGVTPVALMADNIVSVYDQNVQVHMDEHSISTDVESKGLGLVVDLLNLSRPSWQHGTFTTGATGSNIIGLACGREFVLRTAAERRGATIRSVGEHGIIEVMLAAGVKQLQVLSTLPHSSVGKAAGILGIGRANVKSICTSKQNRLEIDMDLLEKELSNPDRVSIVVISCGEVNTGHFATSGGAQMLKLRRLCDKYGSWIHVDGAFGIFGRILGSSEEEYAAITRGCDGIELADSITGDAHKFLNVPYDCGFFLCRHPPSSLSEDVFRNANAAYLNSAASGGDSVPSPLNIGIENSRRLRALPVYASLMAYGKNGFQTILKTQIRLSRMIAGWLYDHPAYTPLPLASSEEDLCAQTYVVVLFRANDESLNKQLAERINATSKMFVSGTSWDGKPACRIAVSNWRTDVLRDFAVVTDVLEKISSSTSNSVH
ncbi:putative tyrosine decarboxylase [Talaromyces proteolyticus]|uniref:Tyrosine decarboxylase n=1 Tax=Talaromyces proteolyticus TaxID=1131652 RepID=A0AAD4Q396_9EURO|nr:putative tyrosine decarboxylase [Talaromyces proteolyticus]KAH8704844.1 putative tyrosine decarboxylase [Talaromyces proteolyticus]